MHKEIFAKITNYFSLRQEVVAVYIFGSYAAGKERLLSDIDIALLIDPEKAGELNKLQTRYLVSLSKETRKDIDIVIMNTAGEELLKQIYENGNCILVNNADKLTVFNMVSFSKIADFAYYKNRMQAGVIRSIVGEPSIG